MRDLFRVGRRPSFWANAVLILINECIGSLDYFVKEIKYVDVFVYDEFYVCRVGV